MKACPILFSGPMIRALLDERKTMTRRVIKPQPWYQGNGCALWLWKDIVASCTGSLSKRLVSRCPYGKPGDLLWVRETWAEVGTCDPGYTVYRATYPNCLPAGLENVPDDIHDAGYHWKPSIFMPRKESRITLEITDVRVERVQDISEDDAIAEGAAPASPPLTDYGNQPSPSYRLGFHDLWDSINNKPGKAWADNPWVWVIKFKVYHMNVDEFPGKAE